jgi:arsenical pump membrane protein
LHEVLALLALVALLAVAVGRPRGVPEVAIALPVVAVLLAVDAISASDAWSEVARLGPVVGFLAAVLVVGDWCDDAGVFRAAGAMVARAAGASSTRLLLGVVVLASLTTALLSLDTTVVLLTPVVIATIRTSRAPPRAPLYATAHLANSASLLLPVSNLTNLLAFAVLPLTLLRFAALMALPWLVTIGVELAALLIVFRSDLAYPVTSAPRDVPPRFPAFTTAVLVLTVIGFGVASVLDIAPVWVATAGAVILAGHRVVSRRTTLRRVVASTAPSFCLFVLGLGVVVRAASDGGLASVVRHVVPSGTGLASLLAVAAVAAVLSNLINNLPATLLLVPIVAAAGGTGPVLAVLIGVNIGPNLTYAGSLATLLWRRAVADVDGVPTIADFTVLGLVTVPVALGAATVALWASLRLIGA